MSVGKLVIDKDRVGAVLILKAFLDAIYFILWNFQAGPAVPLETRRLA